MVFGGINLLSSRIDGRVFEYIETSSTIGARRGCNIFAPVLGRNGTKIAPTGDIFDQPPDQMR